MVLLVNSLNSSGITWGNLFFGLQIMGIKLVNYPLHKSKANIPKGDKPRQFMKNWRQISLLNTVYKLASSCIAERIKSVLPILISNDQMGFIPGRYIGEHTVLINDILHFTEEQEIPGIPLLIYIEKAFNSIS
jgi:hypothetical protein